MGVSKFNPDGAQDIAWCPGCGNFGILSVLKLALDELNLDPKKTVLCSGIGQAAKLPQYMKAHMFNGLHGRSLGPATAIKAVNPELNVIVTSGDGDLYGEGGNHFTHTVRRNPNITVICHDNMVYGLTKGQASPTTEKGMKTPVQTTGVVLEPFNPIAAAIALDASFVARCSINDIKETKEIIKKAVLHKGFALVDIFQPCVTYNKINTYDWFKENTYYLPPEFDCHNRSWAFAEAIKTDKLPLGIFYINQKQTFEEMVGVYEKDQTPVINRPFNRAKLQALLGKQKPIREFQGKIVEIIQETPDVKTFVIKRPKGFAYRAGQYIMLSFPDGKKVSNKPAIPITIASSPTEEHLRLTVKEMSGFTRELFKKNVGDELRIQGPMGDMFAVTEATKDNFVFLSGGTGVTPFLSILRFFRDKQKQNKILMLNGNQTYEDIICRDELDQLSKDTPFIMNSLDRPPADWQGEQGFIDKKMITKYVKDTNAYTFFICGPPAMVACCREILHDLGVSPEKIKYDAWELPNKSSSN